MRCVVNVLVGGSRRQNTMEAKKGAESVAVPNNGFYGFFTAVVVTGSKLLSEIRIRCETSILVYNIIKIWGSPFFLFQKKYRNGSKISERACTCENRSTIGVFNEALTLQSCRSCLEKF